MYLFGIPSGYLAAAADVIGLDRLSSIPRHQYHTVCRGRKVLVLRKLTKAGRPCIQAFLQVTKNWDQGNSDLTPGTYCTRRKHFWEQRL